MVFPWSCLDIVKLKFAEAIGKQHKQLRGAHKGCPIFGHSTHHNLPDHLCKMLLEPTNNIVNIVNS